MLIIQYHHVHHQAARQPLTSSFLQPVTSSGGRGTSTDTPVPHAGILERQQGHSTALRTVRSTSCLLHPLATQGVGGGECLLHCRVQNLLPDVRLAQRLHLPSKSMIEYQNTDKARQSASRAVNGHTAISEAIGCCAVCQAHCWSEG
jgi:hypothetical protein